VIDALTTRDISVVLGTNGTYLDRDSIGSFNKCTRIEINLDGPSAEINNRLRPSRDGGNAWAEAIRAIELCLRCGIRVRVLTTLNRVNQDKIVEIAALLHNVGVRDWAMSWTISAGRAAEIYHELKPQKEVIESQIRLVRVYFPSLNVRYSNRGAQFNRFYFLILPDGQIATQEINDSQKVTFGSALNTPVTSVWSGQNFDLSAHFDKWVAGRITRTYD